MADPIMMSIATTLASRAADAAVDGGRSAWAALVRLVRARLRTDHAAATALDRAQAALDDPGRVPDLARELERLAAADAGFGTQLHALWPKASAELSARDSGVANSNTGTVAGHLLQARDLHVEGGLQWGYVQDAPGHE